ncbi:MAG: iron-containing alcohol dehydrogenase [Suipraeoptans sp.]
MQLFCVKPKVHNFPTFKDFTNEFKIKSTDVLLTEKLMYDLFAKDLNLICNVVLKDEYDTGEPKEETVDQILKDIENMQTKRIIAMGGGSVIDIAKILMIKDAYPIERIMSKKVDFVTDKELVIIPTTCGTGSEVTSGGIVTMKETGLKTALIDERLTATHSILIPELIAGLPYKLFVYCSIDALAHAMESFVSATRGNEFERAMGTRAIEIILDGYADIILNGKEYRKNILNNFIQASCMAGMAVNNGGAGPVHALAYPIAEGYKMGHGESIYQFLTPVFDMYLREKPSEVLDRLMDIIEKPLRKVGLFTDREHTFTQMEVMLGMMHPIDPLSKCGMEKEEIEPFAESIIETKQRLVEASYVLFTKGKAIEIYKMRY